MQSLVLVVLGSSALFGGGVRVEYNPGVHATGPFPSDALTGEDRSQRTGLRVNLPLPDCQTRGAECVEIKALNEYDGFYIYARARVRFSAVWLDPLGGEHPGSAPTGMVTPVNEVSYDPATRNVFAAFRTCLSTGDDRHCRQLRLEFDRIQSAMAPRKIVAASPQIWPLRGKTPRRFGTMKSGERADLLELKDRMEWLFACGAPGSYAVQYQQSPLPGIPATRVLFQIAKGDQTEVNTGSSALIRAAGMREWTSFYLHEVARSLRPGLPANPHGFVFNFSDDGAPIALAVNRQNVAFILSDGQMLFDFNEELRPIFGFDLFEVLPAKLPERLNYLR